jgi:hypothetical protein
VNADDADAFFLAIALDVNVPIRGQGKLILGDLVSLGEVGVEIVFSGKLTVRGNPAVSGQGSSQGILQDRPVENWQASGKACTHRAGKGIGLVTKEGRAVAEDLALGQELGMNLQTDDGFIIHSRLRL